MWALLPSLLSGPTTHSHAQEDKTDGMVSLEWLSKKKKAKEKNIIHMLDVVVVFLSEGTLKCVGVFLMH